MLTKKQFALCLVENFVTEYNKYRDVEDPKLENTDYKKLEPLIYRSSTLAVALLYLGRLTDPSNIRYALERGGVLFSYFPIDIKAAKAGIDKPASLSAREIMSFLPDE